jgi:Xaa-Pro aminopeptidase
MAIKKLQQVFKPKQSIDPFALQTLNIDAISVNIAKLTKFHISSQEILLENQKLLSDILKELKDEIDEGEILSQSGTVTTTDFVFIETEQAPGHPIKGYSVKNDGPNTIYVGHNTTKAGLEPSLDDVTSSISRFREVKNKEEIRFIFNRRRIYNVSILAKGGDSSYRTWLVW